ncbi:hypothetical protein [Azospirillum thermophilum]|uniref:hypothetical protein n=1 Tax=Azospirillum thermophilum TaxID=2202148 RepID=UPI00143DF9B7|nr:hypothetical protein [Azospirillum thermophilum]
MKFITMSVSVRVPATTFATNASPADRASLTRLALEEHGVVERALVGAEIVEVRELQHA